MSKGYNQLFSANPRTFLGNYVVENEVAQGVRRVGGFDTSRSHNNAYLNLVPIDGGIFSATTRLRAEYSTTSKGHGTIIACRYVPYVAEGTIDGGTELPKVQLPDDGNPRFAFTGAMNGCSLVIATDAHHRTWLVHYPNSRGAANGFPHLARDGLNLVKAVNYNGGYGANEGALARGQWLNTFAFAFYDGGWRLLAQPQIGVAGQTISFRLNHGIGLIDV
jgi:hypothetical protein